MNEERENPISYEELEARIKKYAPRADFALLKKAYEYAKKSHEGQIRLSGDDYFVHPTVVAGTLVDLQLDMPTIIAGLLHDVVEDTAVTYLDISNEFGIEIAGMVEGVTKLENIPFSTKAEQQSENLRKMFIAMAKDIRVVIVKLADRLHNMRTLFAVPPKKQLEKAMETMEIYAPIAHRLGMSEIKWELEDLSLRYLDPVAYKKISDGISLRREERVKVLDEIKSNIEKQMKRFGLKAEIQSRAKHFYSIYRKMITNNLELDEIFDLLALRIIVQTEAECYMALGIVHELYKPIPGRFKDYISLPKANGYQSLHTSLIGPDGKFFEVQIRTEKMHRIAEVGVAAHWLYKEGSKKLNSADAKFEWVRQLLDVYKTTTDTEEFMSSLKTELFEDEIFVFSPKGDLIDLPRGSCPLDFAYTIHSRVGDTTVGARINGKMVPLSTKLDSGDIVEVITSKTGVPKRDWLKIVKTNHAKRKINDWFRKENKDENIERGQEIFTQELKNEGIYNKVMEHEELWLDAVLERYNIQTKEDLYAVIGVGSLSSMKVITKIRDKMGDKLQKEEVPVFKQSPTVKRKDKGEVIVKGIDNCMVRLSSCCSPVHGDEIIGYITRGRGVSVHRRDCVNIINLSEVEKGRLIDVYWNDAIRSTYSAIIRIIANDKPTLLHELSSKLSELKIAISSLDVRVANDHIAVFNLTIAIEDNASLERAIKNLYKIPSIIKIERKSN